MSEDEYCTVKEMADMTGVARNTLHRILRDDQSRPESQRRIPGAYKQGSKWRGNWRIPRAVAENWQRDSRGKK